MPDRYDVAVVGAGIAGLTTAALLAHSGARVLVLERHNVPGGCASFYRRDGFQFDVGATLAGGFGEDGIHRKLFAHLGVELAATRAEPAMVVHLADGEKVWRYGDARWQTERMRVFGATAEPFWEAQERIADRVWDLTRRLPSLPTDPAGLRGFLGAFRFAHLGLLPLIGRTVSSIIPAGVGPRLRPFLDAQLLITAQAGVSEVDLAYGATALDLARSGSFHLHGGIVAIAVALARAVRRAGGEISYRTTVDQFLVQSGRIVGLRAGLREIRAKAVVAAIPVADAVRLLPPGMAPRLRARSRAVRPRWSAVTAYVGLPAGVVPDDLPLHHQIAAAPGVALGEGATAFVSLSPPGETIRARSGGRAVTISTHTDPQAWEAAHESGTYEARKSEYRARLLAALDRSVPGASERAVLVEVGTPLTFARYTGRAHGFVGGVPQTPAVASLGALSHQSGVPGFILAGDTVFPGQSTVGASLSGVAAARACGVRI
jgi:C-3',4' desaturase CrtD